MERAVDHQLLSQALGGFSRLPSADELEGLLDEAELALIKGQDSPGAELLKLGWVLHGVGSAPAAAYEVNHQRNAYRVSSHIFDLAVQSSHRGNEIDRIRFCVAAQIGSYHADISPNAIALFRRVKGDLGVDYLTSPARAALECTATLLGLDRGFAYLHMRNLRNEVLDWSRSLQLENLSATLFGPSSDVVLSCWEILNFLVYGEKQRLETAETLLREACRAQHSDVDSQWCAAHLLRLLPSIDAASVWHALPPEVPTRVRGALARSNPPVLMLWPPQLKMLHAEGPSLLSSSTKRSFVSMPTSAGKSLVAQLVVLAHIAAAGTGVCYVAPTLSLCREVQHDLRDRVRVLRQQTTLEIDVVDGPIVLDSGDANVRVMTPERFSFLLRNGSDELLSRYDLFVFDEAHLVGEETRGWKAETAITLLCELTKKSAHRILLLSAAVGNRAHFASWLGAEGESGTSFHDAWRGPRRLTAVLTAEIDRSQEAEVRITKHHGKEHKTTVRRLIPKLSLQSRPGGKVHHLGSTFTSTAELHLRKGKRYGTSTPFYRTILPLLIALGHHGPVMIVCGTPSSAQLYAQALAQHLGPGSAQCASTAALLERRLGASHPASASLRRGVATHYSALPRDVLSEVERLGKQGELRFLVATTGLTEGVNLPFRTVVVAESGGFTQDGFNEYISGATLLNALGRAGRAGRETEGWLVLGLNDKYSDEVFARLRVGPDQNIVSSQMTTKVALQALVAAEAATREDFDKLVEATDETASDFVAYIWQALQVLSEAEQSEPVADQLVLRALSASLLWHQSAPQSQELFLTLAGRVASVYAGTDAVQRKRWAQSGLSLTTAQRLQAIAAQLSATWARVPTAQRSLEAAWGVMFGLDLFGKLLDLPGAPKSDFFNQRSGTNRRSLKYSLNDLIWSWLSGANHADLGLRHIVGVKHDDYRIEQVVSVLARITSFLSWTVSTAWAWANEELEALGDEPMLEDLGAMVREGVNSALAVALVRSGIRSRELAAKCAEQYQAFVDRSASPMVPTPREWLAGMRPSDWNQLLAASHADCQDLFAFVRSNSPKLLSGVLELGIQTVSVIPASPKWEGWRNAELRDDDERGSLVLVDNSEVLGQVKPEDQLDMEAIVQSGLPLRVRVANDFAGCRAEVGLLPQE